VQKDCDAETLAATLAALLRDGPERAAQLAALARLDAIMLLPEGETPGSRAASIVLAEAARRGRAADARAAGT
jgi:lipid-A-disaccharide synthase